MKISANSCRKFAQIMKNMNIRPPEIVPLYSNWSWTSVSFFSDQNWREHEVLREYIGHAYSVGDVRSI